MSRKIPTFKWWGYGAERLPDGPLKQKYQGTAWGRDMYAIYQRSKIVINRHGEIAQNYANNMRMYEATGCGALLVTEAKANLPELFGDVAMEECCAAYTAPVFAVPVIYNALKHWDEYSEIAQRGQKKTLSEHTYAHRIPKIAEVLTGAMQAA